MKTILIHMVVLYLKNYLNLLSNGMDIVFYSEYQIQKNDSFCASYCLYLIYLTKVLGIDFKSAVLNLYYQMMK